MAFKLLIECSKEINELHINFSDGTSVVKTKDDKEPTNKNSENQDVCDVGNESKTPIKQRRRKEEFLDTSAEYGNISQEIVELPEIPNTTEDRGVCVAEELQNFEL